MENNTKTKPVPADPKPNGFRDGVKKEDVLKLTDEEKQFVKGVREAQEAERQNEAAFKLIVLSNQGRSQFEDLKFQVEDNLIKIASQNKEILNNKIDIESGSTEKTTKDGTKLDLGDLEINTQNRRLIIHQYIQMLRSNLAALFQYIDAKGLDMKVYFTEEDYNAIVQDAKLRVEKTGYRLY